jgi:hypothetical protein
LTRYEQQAMALVLLLLLVGWAVRTWRLNTPPPAPVELEPSHL